MSSHNVIAIKASVTNCDKERTVPKTLRHLTQCYRITTWRNLAALRTSIRCFDGNAGARRDAIECLLRRFATFDVRLSGNWPPPAGQIGGRHESDTQDCGDS